MIQEKGFSFIAVEGDWPDCYRVNQYVKGEHEVGATAREVLRAFERWPTWMWANEEIVELAEWLREYNDAVDRRAAPGVRPGRSAKAGFFGLDVYSLWDSLYHVLGYLAKHDPQSLPAARRVFQCFESYGEDAQGYAPASGLGNRPCERQVVDLLADVRRCVQAPAADDGEERLNSEQNALVVKHAEDYCRTMVRGGPAL